MADPHPDEAAATAALTVASPDASVDAPLTAAAPTAVDELSEAVPAPPATAPDGTPVLALPAELTIYAVGELHPSWRDWLAQGGSTVDATAVDQLDGAGVQLLLALARSLQQQGRRLHLTDPSPALSEGCAALGLGPWLQQQTEEVAA